MLGKFASVCLSDICEESTVRHGGAWFKRRVFTVFVLARYDTRREDDYRERLALCREPTKPSAIKRKTAAQSSGTFPFF